jgi:hypothetical protein
VKQVIVITGTVPSDCLSIQLMTEVKWSQSSGPGPRGMLRRGALKDCHFAGGRLFGKWLTRFVVRQKGPTERTHPQGRRNCLGRRQLGETAGAD